MPLHAQFKNYVAKITQSGTNDPVAEIFQNTTGSTPILTRTGVGKNTIVGNFPFAKTFIPFSNGINNEPVVLQVKGVGYLFFYQDGNDTTLYLEAYDESDTPVDIHSVLNTSSFNISIIVYP